MWEINSVFQLSASFYSLVLGAMICSLYDVFRAFRKVISSTALFVFIGDILFSFISSILTFIFLLIFTNGGIRGYVILFEILGFLLFKLTLSPFLLKFFIFILKAIKKFINTITELIFKFSLKIESFSKIFSNLIIKTLKKAKKTTKNS